MLIAYDFFLITHTNIEKGSSMEKYKYQSIVKRHELKETKMKNAIIAFLCGGVIGLIAEGLTRLYYLIPEISRSQATTYMIITLIFVASLFTALGFFDKWVAFFKAGLIIPITGFAHAVTSATIEYKREGLILGIGSNMFKLAGSVIVYGIVAAWFFGVIRYLIGGVL